MLLEDFDIDGLKDLEEKLAQLETVGQNKVLRKAVRAMAKPVKQQVEQNISKNDLIDTGEMVNDVKLRVHTDKRNTKYYDVGATVGLGKDTAYRGYWLEFGVDPHYTNAGSKVARYQIGYKGKPVPNKLLLHPGIEPAPFITPALEQNTDSLINISKVELSNAIEKAIK